MSKKLTGLIMLSAVLTLPAMAAYTGPGPTTQIKTAADAAKAKMTHQLS